MNASPIALDIKTIKQMADGHEFARGEEYCQRGRVRNLIQEDRVYRAYVHRASYYLVKVWQDGQKIRTSCSCHYRKEGVCRHVVATMLSTEKRESTESEVDSSINLYEDGGLVVPETAPTSDPPDFDVDELVMPAARAKAQVARDVMSSPVETLPESASIADAWQFV